MPTVSTHAALERPLGLVTAAGALAMVLLLVAPRASPGCFALLLAIVAIAAPGYHLDAMKRVPMPAALLLGLAAWAAVSTGWAADRGEAIGKAAMLGAFAAALLWMAAALSSARIDFLRQAGRAALAAYAAGMIYLAIEELTGHSIKNSLMVVLPFLQPSNKHMSATDGSIVVSSYFSNRNLAAATLAFWPMMLIARHLVEPSRRMMAAVGLAALLAITLAFSKHETSLVALLASTLVAAVGFKFQRLALGMVAAGWLVATLLVVPLATWALRTAELEKASFLPNSAKHRVVLWGYTAEQVGLRPLHGVGAAATKVIDARRGSKVASYPGTGYEWRSGPHAHNIYLQVWYELGAIGALLLCGAGLALVHAMSRLPPRVMPVAAATMTTAALMGSFSYGLWQAWFLGAFAVGAALLLTAMRLAEPGDQRSPMG